MKNDQEQTMGTISIVVKQIELKCHENIEYFDGLIKSKQPLLTNVPV